MSMNASARLIERVQNGEDREKERLLTRIGQSLLCVFVWGFLTSVIAHFKKKDKMLNVF